MTLKILIADDHAVVRSGLKQFLAGVFDCSMIGEAGTGQETLGMVGSEAWDLVILDVGLPDANGIDILRRIKRDVPRLPVLVFSMFSEDEYALHAIQAGAAGFLTKDSLPDEILEAIRRTVRGERYLSPALTEKLLSGSVMTSRKVPHDTLSERELQILLLLSQGQSIKTIATSLAVSPKTVSTYRSRAMEKLQLASNAELVRYVLQHKLGV